MRPLTSGWYLGHPDSKYFKLERDEVTDHAARKAMLLTQAKRWLAPYLNYDSVKADR